MRMAVVMTLSLVLVYLSLGAFFGYKAYKGPPAHSTTDFLAQGRGPSTRVLVVNIGDSLTQGTFSEDYVGLLRRRLQSEGFEFVNAGVNGAKISDVLKRSREILACKPDAITILIGTNDVRAYLEAQKEHSPVSLSDSIASYRHDLQLLISLLQSGANPRIAILSIPPIGQDLLSPANKVVEQYNDVVQQICQQNRVSYLPLDERTRGVIADFHGGLRNVAEPSRDLSRNVAIQRFFLWQSWDRISERNGFAIHTDAIHLNSRGARVVSDLVEKWLTRGRSPLSEKARTDSLFQQDFGCKVGRLIEV